MKFHILNGNTEPVIGYLQKLPADKQYTVTVERRKVARSLDQNALYWMWIKCLCEETGGDKESVHIELRTKFLGTERVKGIDSYWFRPISTTTLDTKQFTEYLNKIQVFASSELGIVLPSPEDKAFESFKEYYEDRI